MDLLQNTVPCQIWIKTFDTKAGKTLNSKSQFNPATKVIPSWLTK